MLIVFSYIVWLTPAIFCAVILYRYFVESREVRNIYKLFSSIGAISVAVTFKQVLLFKTNLNLTLSFIIGNGMILTAFVVLTWFILKSFEKIPKPPKRVHIYLVILFAFVFYALFKREFLVSVDLLVYTLLIIFVMVDAHATYSVIKDKKNSVKVALFIFSFTLILDFILKSIVEINGFHAFNTVRLISFSVRGISSLVLIFTAAKQEVLLPPKTEKIRKVRFIFREFIRKFIIAVILFSLVVNVLMVVAFQSVVKSSNTQFSLYRASATADALSTGRNLRYLILRYENDLSNLAYDRDVVLITKEGKNKLISYFNSHKLQIDSIIRTDKHGKVVFAYPVEKLTGTDLRNKPYLKELLILHRVTLSPPFVLFKESPVIALYIPVYNGNEFCGSIAVLFDIYNLRKEIVATRFKGEKIIVADCKNMIICAPDEKMIFKDVTKIFPFESNDRFVKCAFGEGIVIHTDEDVFWNKTYKIFVFVPKRIVLSGSLFKILELLLLFFSFIMIFIYALRNLSSVFIGEIENLREFAEEKYNEAESLYKKLSRLVELFSNIDVNEGIKSISFKMLDSMLAVVPSGEAGSVIVKEGDRYVFTAQVGYGKSLEDAFFTEEEIIPAKTDKPFLIKNIFNNCVESERKGKYRNNIRKLLKDVGTEEIKSTIGAPIIVDGEYYGGIFIDNFENEDAFTEEDLKIAGAISKLASVLFKVKKLISSLSETEEKLDAVIDEFSKVDLSMEEKDFFEHILSIAQRLVPADAGSVTLRKGDYYEYMAIFGFDEKLKEVKLKVSEAYEHNTKKAVVVKNIADYNEGHLSEKEKAIIMEAGGKNVKQTLVVPIVVNNEYVGGIFLDSFKEGDVFTERDLKIATALSKLSSVFVAMKIAYENVERTGEFNKASLSFFHGLSTNSTKNDILKIAFEILNPVFKNCVQEVAIGEPNRDKMVIDKFDGRKFTLEFTNYNVNAELIENERAVFYFGNSKIYGKKSFAQVIIFSKNKFASVFRVRFNKPLEFSKEEKEFLERFGRETVNSYQTILFYSNLKKSLINYIFSIGNAVNSYDPYTEWHSTRVAFYSMKIAEALRLSPKEKSTLLFAAVLHDVGKIGISREILLRKGTLSYEETEVMRKHPVVGERIVEPINKEAAKIIRHHHEKWNGKGYPDGLKGEEIPLLSRIIMVADVFDALTTDRPYRKAYTVEKALEIMINEKGKTFDPHILDVFLSMPKEIFDINAINKLTIEEMEKYIVEI